ncbi:M10 family metallopeptidase C-terminal domain-containing protein, partial [Methylobacterium sp. Leaf94]|uniref:M10 family metallopeptidase C-terminal domain-containing protein n=1 Tax=Methylobacterium sp. Leaf94 TaxID=1736250 RepID=UPI001AED0486
KTTGPVVISENTIDWRARADAPTETNEAVRITGENGSVSDVTVKNNILLGGSMTVLVSDGATQTHTGSQVGTVTGVQVVGNVIDYGKYGDLEQTTRYADNMHASGRPVAPGQEAIGALPNLSALNKIAALSANAAIYGTSKGDYLLGGSGSNFIKGGSGDDVIVGGGGRDYITGGAGKDIFVYGSLAGDGIDLISDFKQGADRIDLAAITGAPQDLSGWQWLGSESFTGHDWQLRYETSRGLTTIQIDADGDLKADFQLELTGKLAMSTGDFILAEHGPTVPALPVPAPGAPPLPPLTSAPIEVPQPIPTKPAAPAAPAYPADPSLVLQAPASGGNITGKATAELILGSSKGDGLRGGAGDDVLVGREGKDILYGGGGHDTFRFEKLSDSTAATAGRDYIGDFVQGEDKIDLHLIDANTLTNAHEAFTWIGAGAFTKHAGELRFSANSTGGQVQADVNGDGKVDFAIDMVTKAVLHASDFLL